ncbi:MAG TPA: type I DNA topoisomerase [Candidatus Paceibacterota bacterium]|nr:type I DNA topoisomerase [Candidatus Paceibacterota bacterium]
MASKNTKETLVIVESPAKAKTIEKYLGDGYIVRASVGHVRDLPKSNKDAVDIEGGFVPHYQIVKGKEKVVHDLAELAHDSKEVILATDPDREGEAIAWHLSQALALKHPKRIAFHEITESAIQEALKHPRTIDENLRHAQEARRVLDRLFGYDLSGLIWKKVRYGLSAGRVQSPALRILMEREREIRAFVPEDYWVITADLRTKDGSTINTTCTDEPRSAVEAEKILAAAQSQAWHVEALEESEQKRAARAPFTTSTLQQAASTRLGYSPSNTMRIAQKLYEAGHITYMRTDSTTLSSQAQQQITGVIASEFGDAYAAPRQHKTRSKSAQEAHEAIRPTDARKAVAGTTEEQKKLYRLIRARTLASQMADAKVMRTKIVARVEDAAIPAFTANGSRIIFDGWLAADPAARGEEVELPKVAANDPLTLISAASEAKQTQPPSRYSEAGLVKELEKRGIGRPSTYASIMKTLADRGYVTKEGRTLIPTDMGDVVSSFVEKYFGDYISDSFTSEMEDELDEIAEGKRGYEKTLAEFWKPFHKEVKSKDGIEKLTNLGPVPAEFKCPECGSDMVWKLGKNGRFMSCARFPECAGARKEDGSVIEPPKELDEPCPECGKPLIQREGRFGMFIACSNYPKCKYVKRDESQNGTGVTCIVCNKGEIVEKHGRFGPFYACSNYPDCKFTMKARPTGNICTLCGSLMMEGTKTIPERCSNKECPMHNPHKLGKAK